MIWCLFILLLLLCFLAYVIQRKDILAPGFIVVCIFTLTTGTAALNKTSWNYDISSITMLIVIAFLVVFNIGQRLGSITRFTFGKTSIGKATLTDKSDVIPLFTIPDVSVILITLFGVITLLLYFVHQLRNTGGGFSGLVNLVTASRFENNQERIPKYLTMFITVFRGITFSLAFSVIYSHVVLNNKIQYVRFIPCFLIFLFIVAISGARAELIRLFAMVMFFYLFCMCYRNNWTLKLSPKTIRLVIIVFVCVLILFRLYGYLTGKSNRYTAYENITTYVGSSIFCFDKYITKTGAFATDYHPALFPGIINLFSMIGIHIDSGNGAVPYQWFGHGSTNIYTSFMPYIQRFGVFGAALVEFIIGFVYGNVWSNIKRRHTIGSVLVYGILFYYLTMYSIAERLFSQFFALTTLVEIATMVIFVRSTYRSRKLRKKEI